MKTIYSAALLFSAQLANAAIVEDGLWTGNDWYNDRQKVGVRNGELYSNDDARARLLASPISFDGTVEDYMILPNVQRVTRLFTQGDWDRGFPLANAVYSYDEFLQAVAKFPYFCSESNLDNYTLDEVCMRELSTLFAHWGQETGKRSSSDGEFWTQGLYYVEEIAKGDYRDYGWSNDAWPNQPGQQYYGRGPFQLSWNYNYGQFSNVFATSSYNGKLELLQDPDRVARDGYVAMAAGIWFYMTPQAPKPSMHDVMTGNFIPNAIDLSHNIKASFATTTNIINGGIECGQWNGVKARSRAEYYSEWLNFFNLPAEEDLDCGVQPSYFPWGGASNAEMYFDQDWSGINKCAPVNYQTQYSMAARDDYKRCVCDKFGAGAPDCATADGPGPAPTPPTPGPTPGPTPPSPPTPGPDPWDTWAELEDIRNKPNYSEDERSRTLYQVDREMDFLEKKLREMTQILIDNNLIQ